VNSLGVDSRVISREGNGHPVVLFSILGPHFRPVEVLHAPAAVLQCPTTSFYSGGGGCGGEWRHLSVKFRGRSSTTMVLGGNWVPNFYFDLALPSTTARRRLANYAFYWSLRRLVTPVGEVLRPKLDGDGARRELGSKPLLRPGPLLRWRGGGSRTTRSTGPCSVWAALRDLLVCSPAASRNVSGVGFQNFYFDPAPILESGRGAKHGRHLS
jgi:hypothetical protein